MAINKKLLHFNTKANFITLRLSANITDTLYYTYDANGVASSPTNGAPDIKYSSIVFIKDTQEIWTHGLIYNSRKEIEESIDLIEEIQNKLDELTIRYSMIDLGLPSGTLWADRNIGASSPKDTGKVFQWGDPTPYDIPKHDESGEILEGEKQFKYSDYKWSINGTSSVSKYNSTDGKTIPDLEDDAAYVNMGDTWKIPTKDDIVELLQNTTQELYAKLTEDSDSVKVANGVYNENDGDVSWIYIDGHTSGEASGKLSYMKLLSKSNGNFLIVPSSVFAYNGYVDVVGYSASFWSSSIYPGDVCDAWYSASSDSNYGVVYGPRYAGFGVRGVTKSLDKLSKDIKNLKDTKVDKISGKGLSTNDYTTSDKAKVSQARNVWHMNMSGYTGHPEDPLYWGIEEHDIDYSTISGGDVIRLTVDCGEIYNADMLVVDYLDINSEGYGPYLYGIVSFNAKIYYFKMCLEDNTSEVTYLLMPNNDYIPKLTEIEVNSGTNVITTDFGVYVNYTYKIGDVFNITDANNKLNGTCTVVKSNNNYYDTNIVICYHKLLRKLIEFEFHNKTVSIYSEDLIVSKKDINEASTTENGLMSSEDKSKLDKLQGSIIPLTQAQYTELSTKDSQTLYIID